MAMVFFSTQSSHAQAPAKLSFGIGSLISEQAISNWNIDVDSKGHGLPVGQGNVQDGEIIFQQQCVACHGVKGAGAIAHQLVGGGNLDSERPIKTVGSYWPFATTIFDYIKRAMPYPAPQSLTNDQVYSLTAYLLYLNHIIPEKSVMNKDTLPLVEMPNRNGFIQVGK